MKLDIPKAAQANFEADVVIFLAPETSIGCLEKLELSSSVFWHISGIFEPVRAGLLS